MCGSGVEKSATDLRWAGFERGQLEEGGASSDAIIGDQGVTIFSIQQVCTECPLCAIQCVALGPRCGEKAESKADQVCEPKNAISPSQVQGSNF